MKTHGRTVVFLGPSLDSNEAARHLQASYLPPIRRGDLPAVVADGARSIGIVDGEFGQSLAVSVMEVGAALKQGVSIWGAASMGALRAAECQSMGMVGVGWIFQKYVEGFLRADDEVALLFDPLSHRPTTIPLVNLRWSLQIATEEGWIPPGSASALIELARTVRFTERTYERLQDVTSGSLFKEEMLTLVEFMKRDLERTDRKRLDALLLLETMQKSISRLSG
jgi:TfuA protein